MHNTKAHFSTFCFSVLLTLCVCATSYAESWSDNLFVNGYFTLDISTADTNLNTVSSVGEMREFKEDKVSIKNSLIGGQLEYQFTDNLSLFAQGVAYYDKEGSTTTDINWAYLSYDFDYDIKARAGVFQTPFLQGTELRTIGYSRLWARPLTPGTGASGINEYTGISLIKQMPVADYNWEFQLAAGQGKHDLDEVDVDGLQLLSAKVQHEYFWLRMAALHAEYAVFTPRGQLIIDSGDIFMGSIETEVSLGNTIVNAGFSKSDSKVTPNDIMYYLSLGYRFNDFTPFVMWNKRNQLFEPFDVPRPPNPPQPGQPPNPGSQQPRQTPDGNADMYSFGAGFRWNFAPHLAIKVQAESIRTSDDTGRSNSVEQSSGSIFTLVVEGAF